MAKAGLERAEIRDILRAPPDEAVYAREAFL